MFNKLAPYVLAVILLIAGSISGFLIGQSSKMPGQKNIQETTTPEQLPQSNNLYSYQTASLMGVILKREGNQLTVKNLNTNQEGTVEASSRIIITSLANKSKTVPSSDLSSIELNKDAQISLELVNGNYQVTSIQYILPAPSLPPIPSPAKKP